MRVTLNQNEIFEAITDYLGKTMKLDNSAKVEIALTAGRNPKGYYADVEITYPRSESAVLCVAAASVDGDDGEPGDTDSTTTEVSASQGDAGDAVVTTAATKSADDIFN